MVKLVHTNPDPDSTYHLRVYGKGGTIAKRLAWCHPRHPLLEGKADGEIVEDKGLLYCTEHDITDADAEKLAGAVRGGNLAIVEAKTKKKA